MNKKTNFSDSLRFFHPQAVCLYYIAVLAVIIILPHPILLFIAWVGLMAELLLSFGINKALKSFILSLFLMLIVVLINPLVNHRGPTTLFIFGGIKITLEATLYGLKMGLMLITGITLFIIFSKKMTGDRVMGVLARRLPSLALVFSMLLRLVPVAARDAYALYKLHGVGAKPLGALVFMTMEDGVIRSLSMNDRGFNSSGKKRTSIYAAKYKKRDFLLIIISALFVIGAIILSKTMLIYARYFPSLYIKTPPLWVMLIWCLFTALPALYSAYYNR